MRIAACAVATAAMVVASTFAPAPAHADANAEAREAGKLADEGADALAHDRFQTAVARFRLAEIPTLPLPESPTRQAWSPYPHWIGMPPPSGAAGGAEVVEPAP
jgi:hypothetical protein